MSYFSDKSQSFIVWIFPLLKPSAATEKEYIYFEGDDVAGMYFLKEGSCSFVLPKHQNSKYISVKEGSYFGVSDIIGSVLQNDHSIDDWISHMTIIKR